MKSSPLPTNPHLSAPPLAHWRKLNICLFSPSLPKNLASLSNFSFFFFFFFPGQVWDSLATAEFNLLLFFFFFLGAQFVSNRRLWDSSAGTEGSVQTATGRASVIFRPDRWDCSLDPCAELPGRLIEVHHTWEHQRLASIEIISWPRELLAFELQPSHLNPLCPNEGLFFKASLSCAPADPAPVFCVHYMCAS